MWAFFSKRLRMWLILAVAVPLVGWLLGKLADLVETRRGPSGFSSTLRRVSGWVNGMAKGPFAGRVADAPAPAPIEKPAKKVAG